ncbi:MAG: glutaredoxin family protein [Methylomicrobium sp.]
MKVKLLLFGTQGCHLCELAEALVERCLVETADVTIDRIDIAEHTEWQDRYAIRIPVLLDQASGREIGWPFDADEVLRFIDAAKRQTH